VEWRDKQVKSCYKKSTVVTPNRRCSSNMLCFLMLTRYLTVQLALLTVLSHLFGVLVQRKNGSTGKDGKLLDAKVWLHLLTICEPAGLPNF
jgi:hypothetical protein